MVSTKKTLWGVCMLGALVAIAGCTQNGTSSAGKPAAASFEYNLTDELIRLQQELNRASI